jgi:DnaJ-class molecular chaperone
MSNSEDATDDGFTLYDDLFEDRECPECEGTGYDVDDTPCEYCYGEGIM